MEEGKESFLEGKEWASYLLSNPDLVNAGLLNKHAALDHYKRFGREEGRGVNLLPKKEGVLVFSLSFGGCGLMNQLITLASGMYIAHLLGRDFYCQDFYPQYNDKGRVLPLEEIVDLEASSASLRTRPDKPEKGREEKVNLGSLLHNRKFFFSTLKALYDAEWSILDLGCPFLYNLDQKDDLILDILSLVPKFVFAKKYLDLASTFAPKVDYVSLHLRLEDDMLAFLKSLGMSSIDYISKFRKLLSGLDKEIPIFVASNLNKEKNACNFVLQELERTHRVFYSSSLGQGRELDALVDYLICLGGCYFIGPEQASTFSRVVFCSKRGTRV